MQLLFLDESGKIDQGGLFALGGIAIRDTDWPQLKALWQTTLEDVRLHDDGIVGSGLELDGELVQLCAFSSETGGVRTRIARPSARQ